MAKLSLAKLERHLYSAADRLRQEGLDAATYKDYIFGMLFLKRCSDVFETARAKVPPKHAENPDYYDDFFVPEEARWPNLQAALNDADVTYGSVLDKALVKISEENEPLQHVLDHISFMRMQSNKRVVSDDACRDLVRHFTKYRLRNEDFQFSDLLGSAYEFLINMFAESAGKKGGDFYTPRDVIRLMVRLLAPTEGLSVYDPTCGSGGMLIITREHIEHSGGDPTNLRLCGQVNDASAWSICKLNMLLHGVRGADILLEDTLLHPMHREAGELERFDRVIANPPFSQNYTKTNMEFKERFRWGWCPTTGKKGDLMFAQHMLAVCKDKGMVCTVMPHGVLFRGGVEKQIRSKFLQQDLLEAVISLPPNLFYGAGIPACLLVMRPNLTGKFPNPNKPKPRRGRVLFINADAEYYPGRAQNYLQPKHIEKIASTFERYEDIKDYSRAVSLNEISESVNDFNLNVRRYVDNSPTPEPHDVRAHLVGGIPTTEIEAQQPLFAALGFNPTHAFQRRNGNVCYQDFASGVTDKAAIGPLVDMEGGVAARCLEVADALTKWWKRHAKRLADLPTHRDLNALRSELLASFTKALLPVGVLDRFTLDGVVATWWTDSLPDLKTLMENGFAGVIDGWIDAISDAVEDEDDVGPAFDPFTHKLVLRTMADYLEQIDDSKAEIARLKGEKEAFEQSNPPDDADDEELAKWNYAKDLEGQIKDLKSEIKETLAPVKDLKKGVTGQKKILRSAEKVVKQLSGAGPKSIARAENKGERTEGLRAELSTQEAVAVSAKEKVADLERQMQALDATCEPQREAITRVEAELAPYEQIKSDLAAARATFRELTNRFVEELVSRCDALSENEQQKLVMELFAQDLQVGLDATVSARKHSLVRFIEKLWDKYAAPLDKLTRDRDLLGSQLSSALKELGYVS